MCERSSGGAWVEPPLGVAEADVCVKVGAVGFGPVPSKSNRVSGAKLCRTTQQPVCSTRFIGFKISHEIGLSVCGNHFVNSSFRPVQLA